MYIKRDLHFILKMMMNQLYSCTVLDILFLVFLQVIAYIDSVVPTVRKALCDPLPEVREAAATTFDNLHNTIGEPNSFLC